MNITVLQEVKTLCPDFVGAAIRADIQNSPFSEELWLEIDATAQDIRQQDMEFYKNLSSISATRQVYKLMGKDPSRYRPAAEALIRRIVKNQDLYKVNTAVDLINLASIRHGYSIGGFDAGKIQGAITLGIGKEQEPYEGIGRGILNIAGLPVYRDDNGGFGTPTSDHERTKLSLETTDLLVLINGYDGKKDDVKACAETIASLLTRFTHTQNYQINFYE